jgi:PIN domain nuclease of toxin-antitoxin system
MSALLLDTHAVIWWMLDDGRVPKGARRRVSDADEVFVSAASAWEIRTKHRIGRLPELDAALVSDLAGAVAAEGFHELPITSADGDLAGALAGAHRDRFDRVLIAQALNHRLVLVSNDAAFDAFGVVRVW